MFLQNYIPLILKLSSAKGQLISKEHFVFFNSSKNRMKNVCPGWLGRNFEFSSSFFGRIEDTKRHFEINRPLVIGQSNLVRGHFYITQGCFEPFLNHPPTYIRTFSLHKVRENCHFLDHPPTPMSLRNIKMAPKQSYWHF